MKLKLYIIAYSINLSLILCAQQYTPVTEKYKFVSIEPSLHPDRINLSLTATPALSQTLTWRTSSNADNAFAEIMPVPKDIDYSKGIKRLQPASKAFISEAGKALYHTVTFTDLTPATHYIYRVGNDSCATEWFEFTTADTADTPYSFIYIGDIQNAIFSQSARVIKKAYATVPDAKFILYSGDIVNTASCEKEWQEFFDGQSYIPAVIPVISAVGNHEYDKGANGMRTLSPVWNHVFHFPDNGITGLENTSYSIPYGNTLLIVLNSFKNIEEQSIWLEKQLEQNNKKWVIVAFHHPLYSSSYKRGENKELIDAWQLLFEKYGVDLVLEAHDHNYARGKAPGKKSGPTYIISVAGTKQSPTGTHQWMEKSATMQQLFQVLSVSDNKIEVKAYNLNNQLTDHFTITK